MCKMREDLVESLNTKRLNIQFNLPTHERVVALCEDNKESISDYVNRLIREDLSRKGIMTEYDELIHTFMKDIQEHLEGLDEAEALYLANKIIKLKGLEQLSEMLEELAVRVYPKESKVAINALVRHCNCTLGLEQLQETARSAIRAIDVRPLLNLLNEV